MTIEARFPVGAPKPIAPYSPVIVSQGLVVISGQVPLNPDGSLVSEDFVEQAHQVFRNLHLCLQAAECQIQDVLKVNAYLSDLDDFPAFNTVYESYFTSPYPARTTVQAGLLGFRIEIDAWARQPAQKTTG